MDSESNPSSPEDLPDLEEDLSTLDDIPLLVEGRLLLVKDLAPSESLPPLEDRPILLENLPHLEGLAPLEKMKQVMTLNKTDQIVMPIDGMISYIIHHLPPELLHLICNYLEPMEIARIRLLGRSIAAVGLEHLVAQIQLVAKPNSFDRLLAVAEHPSAGRYVTSLHLFFSRQPEEETPCARQYTRRSDSFEMWSIDFATSAPKLETLSIRYDEDRPIDPPDLKHLVRDIQWSHLKSATFSRIVTSAETLIGFCDRHADTLKDFSLTNISLSSGRWTSLFLKMRQNMELKKMTVAGFLYGVGGECWIMESGDKEYSMKKMIELYILHADPFDRALSIERFLYTYCWSPIPLESFGGSNDTSHVVPREAGLH